MLDARRDGRRVAPLVASALMLAGCASGEGGNPISDGWASVKESVSDAFGMNDPPPTPEQEKLREAAARYDWKTTATGCVAGALVGGLLGAAIKGKEGAAVGAGAGLVAGCGAGHYVALKNQEAATEQMGLQKRIAAANQEIAETQQAVTAARQVVAQHEAQIATLNQQYQRHEIDAKAYGRQVAGIRQDIDAMKLLIDQKGQVIQAMQADIMQRQAQGQPAAELIERRRVLEQQRTALQEQMRALVAAVDTMPPAVERPLVS